MTSPTEIVQSFCDAMAGRDAEALRPYFADDAVYQNTGMPAAVGVDDIVANLAGQFATFSDSYEYIVKNIAASGDTVLTERLDLIRTPSGIRAVPVMGAFTFCGGKITRWTDYWDTSLPAKMMRGEDVSSLVPASY